MRTVVGAGSKSGCNIASGARVSQCQFLFFLEGIFNQIAPMFVLFVFNGLLSQLVSLSERKSQTVMADSAFSEGFVRVDAELPFEHLSRFGAERKLLNLGVNRCLAA